MLPKVCRFLLAKNRPNTREIFTRVPCPDPSLGLVTRYDGRVTRIFRHFLSFQMSEFPVLHVLVLTGKNTATGRRGGLGWGSRVFVLLCMLLKEGLVLAPSFNSYSLSFPTHSLLVVLSNKLPVQSDKCVTWQWNHEAIAEQLYYNHYVPAKAIRHGLVSPFKSLPKCPVCQC